MVANEHLGKCIKVCLTDIWVTKGQSNVKKKEGKTCLVICSILLHLNEVIRAVNTILIMHSKLLNTEGT